MNDPTDEYWLQQLQKGDLEALAWFLEKYEPLLRHTIRQKIDNPSDIDDIYQETVVGILEQFHKAARVGHPKAWMVRIAKSKCVDDYRKKARDTELKAFAAWVGLGDRRSYSDIQHQESVVSEVLAVVSQMGSIYRDVLDLRLQAYTAPEIAARLSIPEGTVKSRLNVIRKKLRVYFNPDIV